MPVNIHGKQYVTVAERIADLHGARNGKPVTIDTEVVTDNELYVTVKAIVTCEAGTFSGHATSARKADGIEGESPLEVAETSAVGRALGFAGFGSAESIASADEIETAPARSRPAAGVKESQRPPKAPPPPKEDGRSALFGLATEMWKEKDAHSAICAALSLPSDGEGAITEHWLEKGGTYKGAQTYLAEVRRLEVGGKSFEDACRIVNAFAQLTEGAE